MTPIRAHVVIHLPHRLLVLFRCVVIRAARPYAHGELALRQRDRVGLLVLGDREKLTALERDVLDGLRAALWPGHHGLLGLVRCKPEIEQHVPLTRNAAPEGP